MFYLRNSLDGAIATLRGIANNKIPKMLNKEEEYLRRKDAIYYLGYYIILVFVNLNYFMDS